MAVHIRNYNVDGFRGINNLHVENLNHINIIAGDNNCGKTSVLESVMLLSNPKDLSTFFSVSRLRNQIAVMPFANSIYNNFINIFSKTKENFDLQVHATYEKYDVKFQLFGVQKKIMLTLADLDKNELKILDRKISANLSEVPAFIGDLHCSIGQKSISAKVEVHEYSSVSYLSRTKCNLPKIIYLSPIAHVTGNNFDEIIRNDEYKNICIRILQLFDPDIQDLLLLKSEFTNEIIEYVKHTLYGNMPLNTYGDGIKKVIALANAIAKSNNGILLIDEVETAIHSKYYRDIFSFILKAAIEFNVQVFITTHSTEAIDGLLETQNYDDNAKGDNISVITLKKGNNKTLSRVLSGRETYKHRENFDFEVRL